jgi:hypothetical protein
MEMLRYAGIASLCLSVFYLAYRLVFKKEENLYQMRIFLLISVALSLLLPLYGGRIDIPFMHRDQQVVYQYNLPEPTGTVPSDMPMQKSIHWSALLLNIYMIVAGVLMLRIIFQLVILSWHYLKSKKIYQQHYVVLVNQRIRNTFSFFDWIFIHPSNLNDEEFEQIIAHEKVHARQYHSIDLVVIELVSCLMWFNPFIWMMKNSIQLVHEYLADEGVLNTGVDRLKYQALLVNQAGEDKLISLFSGFNHSLIKKRMKKMLNSNLNRGSRFKWTTLAPVSACLVLILAVLNGFAAESKATAASPATPVGFSKSDIPFSKKEKGDTIKKKIIKITNINGKIDTTVNETYDIAVDKDKSPRGQVYTYKTIVKDGDSSHYVYVIKDGDPDEIRIDLDENAPMLDPPETDVKFNKEVKVITITKNTNGTNTSTSSSVSTSSGQNGGNMTNTLVIIDGVKHTEKDALASLDPAKIESMNVIKDKKMMKQYTDKNYDSVIVIKTKQDKK